jgi:hypothetical protein
MSGQVAARRGGQLQLSIDTVAPTHATASVRSASG